MISEALMKQLMRYIKIRVRTLTAKSTGTPEKEIVIDFRNESAFKDEITKIYENSSKKYYNEQKLTSFIDFDLPFDSNTSLLDSKEIGHEIVSAIKEIKRYRIAQKKYIDLMACNKYVEDCLDKDAEDDTDANSIAAMERIKTFYSMGFLAGYFMTESGKLSPITKDGSVEELESVALNNVYSGWSYGKYIESLERRIDKEYEKLSEGKFVPAKPVVKKEQPAAKPSRPVIADPVVEFLVPKRKHRKYFNLKERNKDILRCGRKELEWKRQYAKLEYLSKRDFIFGSFEAEYEATGQTDKERFYFRKEQEVYRLLFGADEGVAYKQQCLIFPEDVKVPVNGKIPYEALHLFNTRYAALLGYTGDDYKKNDFMTNAIRKSYTDEGNASYRTELIAARLAVGKS